MIHEAKAQGATIEEALKNAREALNAPADADVHAELISRTVSIPFPIHLEHKINRIVSILRFHGHADACHHGKEAFSRTTFDIPYSYEDDEDEDEDDVF